MHHSVALSALRRNSTHECLFGVRRARGAEKPRTKRREGRRSPRQALDAAGACLPGCSQIRPCLGARDVRLRPVRKGQSRFLQVQHGPGSRDPGAHRPRLHGRHAARGARSCQRGRLQSRRAEHGHQPGAAGQAQARHAFDHALHRQLDGRRAGPVRRGRQDEPAAPRRRFRPDLRRLGRQARRLSLRAADGPAERSRRRRPRPGYRHRSRLALCRRAGHRLRQGPHGRHDRRPARGDRPGLPGPEGRFGPLCHHPLGLYPVPRGVRPRGGGRGRGSPRFRRAAPGSPAASTQTTGEPA